MSRKTEELEKSVPPPTDAEKAEFKKRYDHQHARLTLGLWLGGGAIAGILLVAGFTFCHIDSIDAKSDPTNAFAFKVMIVKFGAHATVALALIYFFYQMLRLAERLSLPFWWFENNIEIARTLLGIRDPMRAVLGTLKDLLGPDAGKELLRFIPRAGKVAEKEAPKIEAEKEEGADDEGEA